MIIEIGSQISSMIEKSHFVDYSLTKFDNP